jgi:shikimate dehydrogenase
MIQISSKTKLTGLLGYPLEHTMSPAMHNRAFEVLNLDFFYLPIEVGAADLADVIRGMIKMNFVGFNITMPHKIEIMKYLDEIEPIAAAIGAVNTVVIKDGRLKGYNTDGSGYFRSLQEETGIDAKGRNVFILGSGGACRALAFNAAFRGADRLYLCNRTVQKAKDLASEINEKVRACAIPLSMEQGAAKKALSETDILINTTSIGMYPETNAIPIEAGLLEKRMTVSDIIYNPLKTRLLLEGEKAGCKTHSGLGMFLYQGGEAQEKWTGHKAPIEAMRELLKETLSNREKTKE